MTTAQRSLLAITLVAMIAFALIFYVRDEDQDGAAAPPAVASTPASPTAARATGTPTATPAPTPTPTEALPEFPAVEHATETGDWAVANGGILNHRARYDTTDVTGFEVAWEFPLSRSGPYGFAAGAPVVADGVAYVQSLGGSTWALDVETGEMLWAYEGGAPTAGPAGPAVEDGRVFVTQGVAQLVALDAATGDELWVVELEKDGFQAWVHDGVVIIGTGNQAHVAGNSGMVHAFDAATGDALWSFQVVEAGFWGNPGLNSGGGVWYPPSIDERRDLVYVGTGNPGPYPGTVDFPNGSSRPGPNLYTSAMVALDLETGALEWYWQVKEHDIFDHDLQVSPMLVHTTIDGTLRELVVGAGKVGRVVALDAVTQEVVWETAVGRHENDDLEEIPLDETIVVYPGIFGGVETPLAFDGERVFAAVVNLPTVHTATGHGAADGSSALLNASVSTAIGDGTGELVALDVATGEVVWRQETGSVLFGGATVVGDVVMTADYAGTIYAFDREGGEEVWRMEGVGGINAWPAVHDDLVLWPIGLGNPRLLALRALTRDEAATPAAP